jgi:2,3-bisphosphoglycerate-independent phosphoglycerate mutase
LEAARTPGLDRLAGSSQWGMVMPVPEGNTPHTHSGVGFLFGLDDHQAGSLARGPIELAGLGLPYSTGEVMLRGNFATLEPAEADFMVIDRRAGRIKQDTGALAGELAEMDLGDGVRATFISTHQHRGVLRLSGPGLDASISDTDPGNVPLPAPLDRSRPVSGSESATRTAEMVNRFTRLAYQRLHDHPLNRSRIEAGLPPANGVIVRGAGSMVNIENHLGRNGISTAVVTGCTTVRGLARLFGFNIVSRDSFSGDEHTDLDQKVASALTALTDNDLVYLHIKAPDVLAHDRDADGKRKFLERVDRAIAPLSEQEIVIGVCADHGTDSNTGWHIADPVPGLLNDGTGTGKSAEVNFGEAECARGPMGMLSGQEFLHAVLEAMAAESGPVC